MNRLDELLNYLGDVLSGGRHGGPYCILNAEESLYLASILRAGRELREAVNLVLSCKTEVDAWEASEALRRARNKYNKAEANNV